MSDALDEIKRLADKTLWRSLASAPKDEAVLVIDWENTIIVAVNHSREGWIDHWEGELLRPWFEPEFWMPLPDPPYRDGQSE